MLALQLRVCPALTSVPFVAIIFIFFSKENGSVNAILSAIFHALNQRNCDKCHPAQYPSQ